LAAPVKCDAKLPLNCHFAEKWAAENKPQKPSFQPMFIGVSMAMGVTGLEPVTSCM
jgi:hypothetical protein